jgi:hypothetical protein
VLGQSLSGYLRDLIDTDAVTGTNAEVIARIARDRPAARPTPTSRLRAALGLDD